MNFVGNKLSQRVSFRLKIFCTEYMLFDLYNQAYRLYVHSDVNIPQKSNTFSIILGKYLNSIKHD